MRNLPLQNELKMEHMPCETLMCHHQSCEAQPCGVKERPQRPDEWKKIKFIGWLEEYNDPTMLMRKLKQYILMQDDCRMRLKFDLAHVAGNNIVVSPMWEYLDKIYHTY